MFHRQYPELKVSASTIQRAYKANKIRFKFIRSSKKVIDFTNPYYRKLLTECYTKVKELRDRGVPIIYLDEAMFTFNTLRKRAWYCQNSNLRVDQESRDMTPLAFIAGIESERGLVTYAIYEDSINGDKFLQFLNRLRDQMGDQEFGLYLDNLSVHKTLDVRQKFKDLNIVPIFNIPYSPDFNGIESYFSLVKTGYKNLWMQLYQKKERIDQANLIETVIARDMKSSIKACINKGFECLE